MLRLLYVLVITRGLVRRGEVEIGVDAGGDVTGAVALAPEEGQTDAKDAAREAGPKEVVRGQDAARDVVRGQEASRANVSVVAAAVRTEEAQVAGLAAVQAPAPSLLELAHGRAHEVLERASDALRAVPDNVWSRGLVIGLVGFILLAVPAAFYVGSCEASRSKRSVDFACADARGTDQRRSSCPEEQRPKGESDDDVPELRRGERARTDASTPRYSRLTSHPMFKRKGNDGESDDRSSSGPDDADRSAGPR